jgi:hypothetical protein
MKRAKLYLLFFPSTPLTRLTASKHSPARHKNLEILLRDAIFHYMSTREALLREIEKQAEPILKQVQDYLAFLTQPGGPQSPNSTWPPDYFKKTAGAFANESFDRLS